MIPMRLSHPLCSCSPVLAPVLSARLDRDACFEEKIEALKELRKTAQAELEALRGESPLPPADYGTTQV